MNNAHKKNILAFLITIFMMLVSFYTVNAAVEAYWAAFDLNPNLPVKIQGTVELNAQTVPWGISRIKCPSSEAGLSSVKVAILDTGIDQNHPDLATNIAWKFNEIRDTSNVEDKNGHGTHVAGTVAALNNGIGVLGCAATVKLYIIQVLNSAGSGTFTDVANGITRAAKGPDGVIGTTDDADVISMSLGASSGTTELANAVKYAYNNGVFIVAASGNEGASSPGYPAAYPEVMAVGAVDSNNNIASWSNKGHDTLAPGVSIYSTYKGDKYATLSGTSMATPHVAAVAAIALARHPTYSPSQVWTAITGSEDSYGIVDASKV